MTGNDVRNAREELEMSQAVFAERVGYSKNHISKIERGKHPVPMVLQHLVALMRRKRG